MSQNGYLWSFASAALLSAGIASAATMQVSQESVAGAGDFDANIIGTIDAFETGLTIAGFYQYGVPNGASYNGELNGGPLPISSLTQSFFVAASDGLSLVTLHDNPNDGSGGNTAMTTILAGGAGGTSGFTVEDDPGEGTAVSDVGGDRRFDTSHNWIACCTDGYAIGALSETDTLFQSFDSLPTGIASWQATSSDLSGISLVLDPGRRVRFSAEPAAVVPLPAAGFLFLCGLGALGLFGTRRRRG